MDVGDRRFRRLPVAVEEDAFRPFEFRFRVSERVTDPNAWLMSCLTAAVC